MLATSLAYVALVVTDGSRRALIGFLDRKALHGVLVHLVQRESA